MMDMLVNLSKIDLIDFNLYEPQTIKITGDKITVQELDNLASRSYPPCMKNLHSALIKNSHLKHWGRLQLGLYLKGMGLSVEESTTFWRQKFSKKTDGDKFEKQYAYNIRHMYGRGKEERLQALELHEGVGVSGAGPGRVPRVSVQKHGRAAPAGTGQVVRRGLDG